MSTTALFLLFSFGGVAHEVFWTGLIDSIKHKDRRLKGRSSLWMFPIYGAVVFIVMLVQEYFGSSPWWIRGLLYSFLILAWEYVSGFLVRLIAGVAPWDYSQTTEDGVGSPKRFQIHGLVCLEYAPIWFIEGLIAEWVYLQLV
ncbi:MAG: hypothetical protein H6624_02535 [Bdellovibrionaceae bacterium]|nr:hypothetical protein [Bdellovibrionales bacterium]MCB9083188.1 hypothetical protein [Pseudobdellovibrionaceae bacterium]